MRQDASLRVKAGITAAATATADRLTTARTFPAQVTTAAPTDSAIRRRAMAAATAGAGAGMVAAGIESAVTAKSLQLRAKRGRQRRGSPAAQHQPQRKPPDCHGPAGPAMTSPPRIASIRPQWRLIEKRFTPPKQKTRLSGSFGLRSRIELLQLGFLVHDVLAGHRIEFLHFDLFRRGALVLGRRVEMTGTGTRFEFDFFAHFPVSLDAF